MTSASIASDGSSEFLRLDDRPDRDTEDRFAARSSSMQRDTEFVIRAAPCAWHAARGAASIITTVAEHRPLRFTFTPLKTPSPVMPTAAAKKSFRIRARNFIVGRVTCNLLFMEANIMTAALKILDCTFLCGKAVSAAGPIGRSLRNAQLRPFTPAAKVRPAYKNAQKSYVEKAIPHMGASNWFG